MKTLFTEKPVPAIESVCNLQGAMYTRHTLIFVTTKEQESKANKKIETEKQN